MWTQRLLHKHCLFAVQGTVQEIWRILQITLFVYHFSCWCEICTLPFVQFFLWCYGDYFGIKKTILNLQCAFVSPILRWTQDWSQVSTWLTSLPHTFPNFFIVWQLSEEARCKKTFLYPKYVSPWSLANLKRKRIKLSSSVRLKLVFFPQDLEENVLMNTSMFCQEMMLFCHAIGTWFAQWRLLGITAKFHAKSCGEELANIARWTVCCYQLCKDLRQLCQVTLHCTAFNPARDFDQWNAKNYYFFVYWILQANCVW